MPSLPVTGTCPTARAGSIKVAPGTGKTVALTFDDGPGPDDQPIVDILARYHVRATFFLTGAHAAARPQNVQVISRAGHLVAGHSYNHQYPNAVPGGWTAAYLHQQLTDSDSLLSRLTGQPVCFFRPPGGFLTGVAEAAAAANLSVAMWSVDSEDWKQPGQVSAAATAAIVAAATAAAGQAHPIVLMHTGKASHEPDSTVSSFRGNTVAALPAVIEWYQGHGYRFVGMDGKS
jgi:peptidoglycan/xylan/chitin deacetylase (PgdA/CDA1 family)